MVSGVVAEDLVMLHKCGAYIQSLVAINVSNQGRDTIMHSVGRSNHETITVLYSARTRKNKRHAFPHAPIAMPINAASQKPLGLRTR